MKPARGTLNWFFGLMARRRGFLDGQQIGALREAVENVRCDSGCGLSFIKTPFVPVRGAVFGSWEDNRDLHGSATAIEPVR